MNWQRQNRRRHLNRQRQRRRWHHRLHRQCLRARAGRRRPIRLCATLLLVVALGINGDRIALDSKWSTSLFLSKKVFIPLQSFLALFQGIAKLQHCPGCACKQALLSIHLALELFEAGDLVKTSTLNRLEIAGMFACWNCAVNAAQVSISTKKIHERIEVGLRARWAECANDVFASRLVVGVIWVVLVSRHDSSPMDIHLQGDESFVAVALRAQQRDLLGTRNAHHADSHHGEIVFNLQTRFGAIRCFLACFPCSGST